MLGNNLKSLSFKDVSALVIGDIMLDIFLYGKSHRLSPEAPVPIVVVDHDSKVLGGAGNVASNLKSLGAHVDICGFVGEDVNDIRDLLGAADISAGNLILCKDMSTITKTRIVSNGQHLVRFDKEVQFNNLDAVKELEDRIKKLSERVYDFVIISDYNKGVISQRTMDIIKESFKSVPIFVDPRPKNVNLYKGVFCITPNLHEAQTILNTDSYDVEHLAKNIKQMLNLKCVVITLSEKGLFLLGDEDSQHINSYQIQTEQERLHRLDVSGAGDTLIGTFAACLSSGHSISESAFIGNVAAAIVVNKLGTAICSIEELNRELQHLKD